MNNSTDVCISFFMLVSLFVFVLLIDSGVTFLSGGSLGFWQAPLAFGITVAWGILKRQWKALTCFLIIGAVALLGGFVTFDYSCNSINYHKPCVELLVSGWNPVYDGNAPENVWIRHYARGQELLAAVLTAGG